MYYERICELICAQFELKPEEISRDTNFVEDLKADSLDFVELTMRLEEEFGLSEIPEDVLMQVTTVGKLVDYVERHV